MAMPTHRVAVQDALIALFQIPVTEDDSVGRTVLTRVLGPSLTDFAKPIFQPVPGAVGRPEPQIIKRTFNARRSVDSPAAAAPRPAAPPPAAPAPPPGGRGWQRGEPCQGRPRGQGYQGMNKRVCACNDLKPRPLLVQAMLRFQKRTKIAPPPGPPARRKCRPCTDMYRHVLLCTMSCTAMYQPVPPCTISCTAMYRPVLPCTALYAVKYVRVRTFGFYPVLVRTGMYRYVLSSNIFQVVRTGTYYIIVQVGTYRYVPVRTDINQGDRIPDEPVRHMQR